MRGLPTQWTPDNKKAERPDREFVIHSMAVKQKRKRSCRIVEKPRVPGGAPRKAGLSRKRKGTWKCPREWEDPSVPCT